MARKLISSGSAFEKVAGYSRELCGGTHCAATGQVGGFVIVGDRPIGSGMRRVEALTGDGADALVRGRLAALDRVAELVGAPDPSAAAERVAMLQGRLRELERRLRAGGGGLPKPAELARRADELAPDVRWVSAEVDLGSVEELKAYARDVRGALPSGVIALVLAGDEPQLFVTVSEDLVARGLSAAELVRVGAAAIGGRGGGRPEMAQGRGRGRQRAGEALAAMRDTATAGLAGASGA